MLWTPVANGQQVEFDRAREILRAVAATSIQDPAGSVWLSALHRCAIGITRSSEHPLPLAIHQTSRLLGDIREFPDRYHLLDFESRLRWIGAELDAVVGSVSAAPGTNPAHNDELARYRDLFRENASGGVYAWEFRNRIHQKDLYEARLATGLISVVSIARQFEARCRSKLKDPDKPLDSKTRLDMVGLTTALRFDCFKALIVGLERSSNQHWNRAVRVLTHAVTAALNKEAPTSHHILSTVIAGCAGLEREISFALVPAELAEDLRLIRYTQSFPPPEHFWQDAVDVQRAWVEMWNRGGGGGMGFPVPFPADKLRSVFSQRGGECLAMEWKGELAGIGIQITSQLGFSELHRESISALERRGVLSPRPRAWNFLVAIRKRSINGIVREDGNPHGILVRACAQSCHASGADEALAVVDTQNAALRSHLREGCELLDGPEFATAAGRKVRVIRRSFVQNPLEELIFPRR